MHLSQLTTEVFTAAQLEEQGVSRRQVAARVRQGRLHTLRTGCYVNRTTWDGLYRSQRHALEAIALTRKTSCAISHQSAAILHDLPILGVPERVHAYIPANRRCAMAGVRKHMSEKAVETTELYGVPVTSALQTVRDCAAHSTLWEAVCIVDAALHRGMVDPYRLSRFLEGSVGRGARQARLVSGLMSEKAESPGESILRLQLNEAGIDYEEQTWVRVCGLRYRPDFTVRGHRLIIEFDGNVKYREKTREVLIAERQRERELQNAGWTVLRFGWDDLWKPGHVAGQVRAAMRRC